MKSQKLSFVRKDKEKIWHEMTFVRIKYILVGLIKDRGGKCHQRGRKKPLSLFGVKWLLKIKTSICYNILCSVKVLFLALKVSFSKSEMFHLTRGYFRLFSCSEHFLSIAHYMTFPIGVP